MTDNNFSEWTDVEIFKALQAKNTDVWRYVLGKYVVPICRGYYNQRRMKACHLDDDDIYNEFWVFVESCNDLNFLNSEFSFEKWTKSVISKLLFQKLKEENYYEQNTHLVENSYDRNVSDPDRQKDKRVFLEKCFSKLWIEYPRGGYVLLLKVKFSLTHAEIAKILNLTKNAVAKIYGRSKKKMQSFDEKKS